MWYRSMHKLFFFYNLFSSLFLSFVVQLQCSGSITHAQKETEKRIIDSMENKTTEAPTKIIMIASIVRIYTKCISLFFYFVFIYLSVLLLFDHVSFWLLRHCSMFFFVSTSLSSARSLTLNLVSSHLFQYLHIKCHTDIWRVCVFALAALCLLHA